MSLVFTINFRREAFRRARARARERVLRLGVWLAYFGIAGVVLGLYALHAFSLASRTSNLERLGARMRALQSTQADWRPVESDVVEIERHAVDAGLWRDRLARIGRVLPSSARLTSLQWNPDNISGVDLKLVLSGISRVPAGQDRMQSVMTFVHALQGDTLLSNSFRNIRLVTTSATESGDARFVIECR